MDRKRIPIGYEDFKEIRMDNLYFVDKTRMIAELLDGGKVTLITRPRRFGKTLNLSMLRRFFEDERTPAGEKVDNRQLFEGLAIQEADGRYLAHMGRYPVISLSLKSGKQASFRLAYGELKKCIREEYKRHRYVLASTALSEKEKEIFQALLNESADDQLYLDAVRFLSECLYSYHGKEAVILIDEYDVPLENAYFQGFYEEMTGFVRSLFESALKTNPYLKLGVVTGCLRISRESIFTGLNNLEIHSVISPKFSDCFGFTGEEVQELLFYYGLTDRFEEARLWYNGYLFGNIEIYNPWSILNYISNVRAGAQIATRPYWSNTSGNDIVKSLVEDADETTRGELELLMDGGSIEKPIHEDITYGDIHASRDNLWNLLFFTGYLKMESQRMENRTIYIEMAIPNEEIASIYENSIKEWFSRRVETLDRGPLIRALEEGDCEAAADFISRQLMDTISYFDYAESYYHGFLAGLLKNAGRYQVLSNRESGSGRPDLVLKEKKFRGRAIIIELKAAKSFVEMEKACEEALWQIEQRDYAAPLAGDGYQPILKYGIALYKKGCIVRTGSVGQSMIS